MVGMDSEWVIEESRLGENIAISELKMKEDCCGWAFRKD